MPHATIKIIPGVNTNETPALNEAGLSFSNLIRFFYDPTGIGLVQKLGGWSKFFPSPMTAVVRALWAWADTNDVTHLAIGMENNGSGQTQLNVITNGSQQSITPRSSADSVTPAATTTMGSPTVVITDATSTNITDYDVVYIETHISVGGLVLFGLYQTSQVSSTTYDITATDIFGNPLAAASGSSSASVALFTTVSASATVTVTLNDHGYVAGATYPVLISTTVGGVTLYGNYIVQSVVDANNFTITAASVATSGTTGSINGGNAAFIYSYGVGPLVSGTGYGIGGYGRGGYGTGAGITPGTGTAISADNWTLDNFGEVMIACPINGTIYQPIYAWDPLSGSSLAEIIPQAPPLNDGVFVAMPERMIIAWGSTFTGIQDPLLIRWCDANNFGVWIAQATNQAGSYRIARGSKIVACIQGPQQGLVFTDIDCWSMQYIAPSGTGTALVWGFNEIGTGCGLIARKAVASFNGAIYWMGQSQFFTLGGLSASGTVEGVGPLECPVWDVVFQQLDRSNADKIRVAVNSLFGEITWYYPTLTSGGEVAAYVKYNAFLAAWDYGQLGRSAWVDQSVLGFPIGADPSSLYLYQHETSPDADGQALLASCQTGYFTMQEGDFKTFVDQFWPDAKWGPYGGSMNATVMITFYVVDYPGQTPTIFGPFSVTQATTFFTPRFRGRLVSIGISSSDVGSFWRIGANRYRLQQDGKF